MASLLTRSPASTCPLDVNQTAENPTYQSRLQSIQPPLLQTTRKQQSNIYQSMSQRFFWNNFDSDDQHESIDFDAGLLR